VDRHEVAASIRKSWAFLESAGLAETFAFSDPLPLDVEFRDLVLSEDSGHLSLYQFCLRKSYYNILLFDHSFLQFGWAGGSSVRYAYYPNPHASKPKALHAFRRYRDMVKSKALDEDEFSQLVQGMKFDGGVPIFRYEHSESQYVALSHPCSHLHIGVHGENRWAVSRLLSPLAFTLLISKHYYPGEWGLGVIEEQGNERHQFEEILATERTQCRPLSEEFFCATERQTFHFG